MSGRLQKARKVARQELGQSASEWDCKEYAVWLLALDTHQAALDAGKAVDVNDMVRIVGALQAVRDRRKSTEQPKLELHIVDDTVRECPFCKAHFNPRTGKAVEPEPLCGEVLPPIADKQRPPAAPAAAAAKRLPNQLSL